MIPILATQIPVSHCGSTGFEIVFAYRFLASVAGQHPAKIRKCPANSLPPLWFYYQTGYTEFPAHTEATSTPTHRIVLLCPYICQFIAPSAYTYLLVHGPGFLYFPTLSHCFLRDIALKAVYTIMEFLSIFSKNIWWLRVSHQITRQINAGCSIPGGGLTK